MEKSTKKGLIIALVAVAILSIVACVACGVCGSSGSSFLEPETYRVGEIITVDSVYPFQFSVMEVKRGNEALSFLRSGNGYVLAPKSGYEYILFKVWVKNTGLNKLNFMVLDFQVYADSVLADPEYALLPDGESFYSYATELLPNGTYSAWELWEVPINSNCKLASESSTDTIYAYVQL